MKNLIVIIGTIMLGILIFNMLVGNNPESLKNISREMMLKTIETYNSFEIE